jgi:hypothetical protein
VHVTQANRRKVRAPLAEFPLVVAQLRNVLAAENSPVVPQKHDHSGNVGPQISEPHLPVVGVR